MARRSLALSIVLAIAATSAAAAPVSPPPAQLAVQPPAPDERIPPPPGGPVTWLPGSWRWSGIAGAEWQWQRGRYVAWPPADDQPRATPDGRVGIGDGWQ
jgi:hypothetical protein